MTFSEIYEVADLLPFHLDDTPQVNTMFTRWRNHHAEEDKRLIDIWTYCYVYRYFLLKLSATQAGRAIIFDRLVATAFADVQNNLSRVRQPGRYAGWVSTICRNAFVTHLRTQRSMVSIESGMTTLLVAPPVVVSARDASLLHQSVCQAIEALPGFLREVARMRLVENRSYVAIQEVTGKALPTLRTYVNRALNHLRRDAMLQTLCAEMRED